MPRTKTQSADKRRKLDKERRRKAVVQNDKDLKEPQQPVKEIIVETIIKQDTSQLQESKKQHVIAKRTDPKGKEKEDKKEGRQKAVVKKDKGVKKPQELVKEIQTIEQQNTTSQKRQTAVVQNDTYVREPEEPVKEILVQTIEQQNTTSQLRESKKEHMIAKRADPAYREKERQKKAEKREDPTYLQKERQKKAEKRSDPAYLEKKKIDMAIKRTDPTYKEKELKYDENKRNEVAKNPELHNLVKQQTKIRMGSLRSQPEYSSQEKAKNRIRISNKRKADSIENVIPTKKRIIAPETSVLSLGTPMDTDLPTDEETHEERVNSQMQITTPALTSFAIAALKGPTTVCCCCLRLWFPSSCKEANRDKLIEKIGIELYNKVTNDGESRAFCTSCLESVRAKKIPRYCAANYMITRDIPDELKGLSTLEERMVSARIPFMQIRQVGYGRQCSIKGQVVNVPLNVDTTTKVLPRNFKDTQTIQIKLKRKMNFKSAYICETVRPKKVFDALRYLCQQELYMEQGISISDEWENEIDEFIRTLNSQRPDEDMETVQNAPENDNESDIFDYEEEEPVNPGGQETLLDNNALENICFAPGEGIRPIHLLNDQYCDELSFPSIFCGYKKEYFVKYTIGDELKVQLQNRDKRFTRTDYLLYQFKKTQLSRIMNAVDVCLRQKKDEHGKYSAGQVLQPQFLEKLIQKDAGFKFLKTVKNSPAYWKTEKNKLVCMVRQYGIPTIFFTISAAEITWNELIVMLVKVIDNKDITLDQASALPYTEKTRLIRLDPVTCARYFDYRFKLLFKHMKSENGPFKCNPIIHHYYRVEFQHRGSPHVHGILWLANAPQLKTDTEENAKSSTEAVATFVDKYITCDGDNASVKDIISFNTHHHSTSCKKDRYGKKVCRYGFPFLPMDKTVVLLPAITNNKKVKESMTAKMAEIKKKLEKNVDMSLDEFLLKLNISKEEYMQIIQYNILKPTIFLKRKPKDCYINNYNEEIFSLMRSNMDIQFILEPYACLSYIVNYINKSQRGVSELMIKAMEDMKKGNADLKAQLRAIAGAFLNASEVSAQEAAYSLLQLKMHMTCTNFVHINTKPKCERVRLLKGKEDLRQLNPDDVNIYVDGAIEHYVQRPNELADLCLAEFVAYYYFCAKPPKSNRQALQLKDGSGYLLRKGHENIISYRRYGLEQDPVNFYREQLMLYLPWRNENNELVEIDQQLQYAMHSEVIANNRKKFDVLDSRIIDDALEKAEQYENDVFDHQHISQIDEEYAPYNLDVPEHDPFENAAANGPQNNTTNNTKKQTFPTPFQISDEDYDRVISQLNEKQYEFLNHVIDSIPEGKVIYNVLGGPAGAGKSHLILAITQTLLRHYNSISGNNPDSIKVLLAAPTGKAAFGIRGITLHTAFSLPVNQYNEDLIPLNNDVLNTIYSTLHDLKLIIIDEYSMVGSTMLDYINRRLQQIFKCNDSFGGISTMLFGDLRQLPPVGDRWIFAPARCNPYSEICGTLLWDEFRYFQLTEIMRQNEDKEFAVALNNMASGTMTEDDITLIKSREVSEGATIPESAIHLFCTNNEVDAYNEMKLSKYDTEYAVCSAQDIVKGSCSERLKKLLLTHAKGLKKSESFGLMPSLRLQVGAKYMISNNIDTQDGIVNGATCQLRRIDRDHTNQTVKCVWVEFIDDRCGKELRKKYATYMNQNNIPDNWTIIEKCARAIKIKKGCSDVQVERLQFPLLISEGITIHKSQGSTYQQVAVHIGARALRSSIYVACSRATKLSGLYIFGSFKVPKQPTEKDAAFNELRNLRENKLLNTRYDQQYLSDVNDKHIFIYQNVQSLSKHLKFIENNPLFKNADVLIFVETWLNQNDNVHIDNFDCFINICLPSNSPRKPFGISCFKRNSISDDIIKVDRTFTKNMSFRVFQSATFFYKDIYVIVVYIPPNLSINDAKQCLAEVIGNHKRVLIIGDFNVDLISNRDNSLKKFLIEKGLISKLDTDVSTTKSSTQIDWVFGDVNNIKLNVYNTVYSHHKAISLNAYSCDIDNLPQFAPKPIQPQISVTSKKLINVNNNKKKSKTWHNTSADLLSGSENDIEMIDITSSPAEQLDTSHKPIPLQNADKVSCYANSVIQFLLSLPEFVRTVSDNRNSDIFRAIFDVMTKRTDNCLQIRSIVDPRFTVQEQQDGEEFVSQLLVKLGAEFQIYVNVFTNEYKTCSHCNYRLQGHRDELIRIYDLYFSERNDRVLDFSSMFGPKSSDQLCNNCSHTLEIETCLAPVHKYLIICLRRPGFENGRAFKHNNTFSNFNSEHCVIDGMIFKVKAAITHIGETITSGHYFATVRYDSRWWCCNDSEITQQPAFDNTLKDVYLLIMEKIGISDEPVQISDKRKILINFNNNKNNNSADLPLHSDNDIEMMDLTSSLAQQLDISDKPIPLKNPDHVSCYANSVLQFLLTLKEFHDTVSEKDSSIDRVICDVITKRTDNCLQIRSSLYRGVHPAFSVRKQQDAEEFLNELLYQLNPLFSINFDFFTELRKICSHCNFGSIDNECGLIFNLYFSDRNDTVLDFSSMFWPRSSEEPCCKCSHPLDIERTLYQASKYLILCLRRYGNDNGEPFKHNNTFSDFNSEHCLIQSTIFKVKAAIKHIGPTITSGHYFATVRYGNRWWLCDDNLITQQPAFDNTLKDVYLLIMEKIKIQ